MRVDLTGVVAAPATRYASGPAQDFETTAISIHSDGLDRHVMEQAPSDAADAQLCGVEFKATM
jgi:hypothetical protein